MSFCATDSQCHRNPPASQMLSAGDLTRRRASWNVWHLPANPEPRGRAGMRDPVFPTAPLGSVTILSGNQFQGGGNAGNQLQTGSAVLFKQSQAANWTNVPMVFTATIGNNKYYSAQIHTTGLAAGTIIQYYLHIAYDDHDTT